MYNTLIISYHGSSAKTRSYRITVHQQNST